MLYKRMFDILTLLSTNKPETVDVTTKEGYEKAMEVIKEVRKNPLFEQLFFGKEFIDELETKVNTIYEEANKQEEIVQPSTKCTDVQKEQVTALVNEYVDTLIQPIGKFDDKVLKSVKNSLFEFACWILNK